MIDILHWIGYEFWKTIAAFLAGVGSLWGVGKFLGPRISKLMKHMGVVFVKSPKAHAEFVLTFGEDPAKAIKDALSGSYRDRQELQAKIEVLSVQSKSALFITDSQGKCTWVSSMLSEMFGISHEAMLGSGWLAGVCPDDRQKAISEWQFSVANGFTYSATYKLTDGTEVCAGAIPFGKPVTYWAGWIQAIEKCCDT